MLGTNAAAAPASRLPLPACSSIGRVFRRLPIAWGPTRRFAKVSTRVCPTDAGRCCGACEHATTMISPSRCSTPGPSPATSSRFTKSVLPTKPICGRPRSDFRFWSSRAYSDISLVQVWLRPRIWPSRWKTIPACRHRRLCRSLWRSGPRCRQFLGRMSNRKPSRRLRPSKRDRRGTRSWPSRPPRNR